MRATAPLHNSPRARFRFAAALFALVAFKLWLVHEEEIVGSATQFDALWYVRSASHWYWGRAYDWVAFIRPCSYPLFIAAVNWLHLPLRLAIELLQLSGALVLVAGLRSLGVNRLVSALACLVICLHPAGYQLNNYSMSDTFYAGMLWWVLGGLLLLMATFRLWLALLTGAAVAVLWNAREEGVLLIAILLLWTVISLLRLRRLQLSFKQALLPLLGLCLVATSLILAAYSANRAVFRSFARSEMNAPAFQALFHSLLRIRPDEPKRYAPITAQAMSQAFRVSPTYARLQSDLEGGLGHGWQTETFLRRGVKNEIGAGWIVWATRQAAGNKGYFTDPEKARRFFRKAAREIDAACDDGRLPTRFVLDGFLDPLAQTGGIAAFPQSFGKVIARLFAHWSIVAIPDDKILTPDEAALYDRMTLRSSAGVSPRHGLAFAIERFLGRYYFVASILLHLLALSGLVALFYFRSRGNGRSAFGDAIMLLSGTVLLRVLLFSWLDATAFDGTEDRFLFPVLPLWMVVLLLTAAWGISRFREVHETSKP